MQHDRESRNPLFHFLQNIETQRRRHQDAVRVPRALFRLELVGPVRSPDGNRQRIHPGMLHKVFHLFRLRIRMMFGLNLVLDAGQNAQFPFHRHIVLVRVFHHLLGQLDILGIRQMRAVDHHRRETVFDAALAKLETVPMVQMQHDRHRHAQFLGVFHRPLRHIPQQGLVRVIASALRHLQNHRRLRFRASRHDGLQLLHIIEIESRNRIMPFHSLPEQLAAVHQTEFLVICHIPKFLVLSIPCALPFS